MTSTMQTPQETEPEPKAKKPRVSMRTIVILVVLGGILFLAACVSVLLWGGWNLGGTLVTLIAAVTAVIVALVNIIPAYQQVQQLEESGLPRDPSSSSPTVDQSFPSQPANPPAEQPSPDAGPAITHPLPLDDLLPPQGVADNLFTTTGDFLILEGSQELQNAPFFGRTQDAECLTRAILDDHCRIVAITAKGGSGKTRLAVKVIREVEKDFWVVVGISLRNAPPLKEVLHECLQKISHQSLPQLPDDTDACVKQLLHYLRAKRCLLFFDNSESILQPDDPHGRYLATCQEYEHFFQLMAETGHQSCLFITGREKHRRIAIDEGRFVRIHHLKGLSIDESLQLLNDRGLSGTDAAKTRLVELYGGNPLELKLVSRCIKDVYQSNIDTFFASNPDTTLIDEVEELLERQFSRLTLGERKIMYCLALAREPVTLGELAKSFLHGNTAKQNQELLRALQSLKGRDLVDNGSEKLSLQMVILEYTTKVIIDAACQEITSGSFDMLEHHSLLNASGRDYVRESQLRLILHPVLEQLHERLTQEVLEHLLKQRLDTLRQPQHARARSSCVAGNIINLWIQAKLPLKGADFSHLEIRQAYFQGVHLQEVNFSYSDLETSVFTDTFGDVFCVALQATSHGELLATGTSTNEVRLWQRQSDSFILWRVLAAHTDWVRAVTFDPEGHLLASGGDDQEIYLWQIDEAHKLPLQLKEEKPLKKLPGHQGRVYSLAFSPDGKQLVSAGEDEVLMLWDVHTGTVLRQFDGHHGNVYSVAFHKDGHMIISSGKDHTIKIWDVQTGQCMATLSGHADEVFSVTFNPDCSMIASASRDGSIRIWDAYSDTLIRILPGDHHPFGTVRFSPDGRTLFSGEEDGTLRGWNVETGECFRVLKGHRNRVWSLALSADGVIMVSGSRDQSMRIWDVCMGKCLQTQLGSSTWIYAVAFNPSGTLLATGSGGDNTIRLWNPVTGEEKKVLESEGGWVRAVAFNRDGKLLASAGDDKRVRLWDVASGQLLHTFVGHTNTIRTLAFHPGGKYLVSAGEDHTIRFWNVNTYECEQLYQAPHSVWSIAFNPKGTEMASAGDNDRIYLWTQGPDPQRRMAGHESWIYAVTYSPDGRTLVSCGQDQTVRLWSLMSKGYPRVLTGHESWVHAAAFNPTGNTLVTVSQDQTLRVWKVNSGTCTRVMTGHTHWIFAVAFSPDGRTVASGAGNGETKVWDVQTGVCKHTLRNIRPYEKMDITGVKGLQLTQLNILRTLGAIEKQVTVSQ